MKTKDQQLLTIYVRIREDFQSLRKNIDNRLGLKADGSEQKTKKKDYFSIDEEIKLSRISINVRDYEKTIEKDFNDLLERFPIWNEWLKDIKGIGKIAGGWILGEFDIQHASTVSKMWQYAGLNPGIKTGKKRITKKDYKPDIGKIIREEKNIKTGEIDYIIETEEMIPGDRLTTGFLSPYNKNLKRYLLGVMAPGFIKAQNCFALEYYYPYKNRLENESSSVMNSGQPRKDTGKPWKQVNKGHRDNAARRYMVKMFLKDLYINWREIEGLSVRQPYAEEYLEKKHSA